MSATLAGFVVSALVAVFLVMRDAGPSVRVRTGDPASRPGWHAMATLHQGATEPAIAKISDGELLLFGGLDTTGDELAFADSAVIVNLRDGSVRAAPKAPLPVPLGFLSSVDTGPTMVAVGYLCARFDDGVTAMAEGRLGVAYGVRKLGSRVAEAIETGYLPRAGRSSGALARPTGRPFARHQAQKVGRITA